QQQKMVAGRFLSGLDLNSMPHVGGAVWPITSNQHVLSPAVSLVKAEQVLSHQQDVLKTVECIASNEQLEMRRSQRFMDILFDTEQVHTLNQEQDSHQLAQLIGAELIPVWPSRRIVLANAHGLHARPATHLVNMTKKFAGDILVAVDEGAYVS